MLNRSAQAARFGHRWTWGDHNKIISGIEEIKLRYKNQEDELNNLKEIIDSYESLVEKLKESKSITTVRKLLTDFYIPEKPGEVRKNLKVYLSGSADEKDYRKGVKAVYGKYLNLYDPIEAVKPDNPNIVNIDKEAIESSDIFVAFIRKLSIGTIMEIQFAFNIKKDIPIYVITSDKYVEDLWLSHHASRFFPSIRSCFDFILNDFNVLPVEERSEEDL